MTEIDQTMRNLLAVYRAEVNELQADVERWKNLAEVYENEARNSLRKNDNLREDISKYREEIIKHRNENGTLAEKVHKQNGIIESLRIELADEREAHTATKDKLAATVGAEMRGGNQ